MRGVFLAAGIALALSILLTPYLIRFFARQGFGQEIRADGPQSHQSKRGTPTMGGVAILLAIWVGYLGSHAFTGEPITASALLVLFLTTALGIVGFVDDFLKIRRQRNLGLNKTSKIVGQVLTATIFGVLALRFANNRNLTPASDSLSFVRDITVLSFGLIGFVILCNLIVAAWSNAVNLTDGLDGLAAGTSAMVLGTYVIICFWQFRNSCSVLASAGCYEVRDPLDVGLVAAAAMGGCIGFLWWNASPARIFMGDTGSLALGGLLAGLSMVTHTELLLVVIGGVFVVEALSVSLQIVVFRTARRRLFRMAPFHHHFELAGWAETTVIIRFWLLAAMCAAMGLGIFYSEWLGAAADVAVPGDPVTPPPADGCDIRADDAHGRHTGAGVASGWHVLVAGAGVSGRAAAEVLLGEGAAVTVSDDDPARLADLPHGAVAAETADAIPDGVDLVVTSPGRRPDHPLVAEAAARGVEVIGEPELAWRLGQRRVDPPAWLVVTGTNGKTTTTEMLAAILRGAGLDSIACGNIGFPVVSAVADGHRVLAVELSSFQLHWSPSVRPQAGVVLNVAEDHLDWHGGMDGYASAKAAALVGDVAVAGVDDPVAARLLDASPAARRVGVTLGEPGPDQLGVSGGDLVDRAFGGGVLLPAAAVVPPGPPGVTDALAAAALARAHGVSPAAVGAALASFAPGPHRSVPVGDVGGVRWVDDSKATNPHAADAALAAIGARSPGARAVWVVGGLLKGVSADTLGALARRHAPRLAGVVVIGTDRAPILDALARHTPEVPVHEVVTGDDDGMQSDPMPEAVRLASGLAAPGDVVLLAPAAASMDQFRDYAHRGRAFADAVAHLAVTAGGAR